MVRRLATLSEPELHLVVDATATERGHLLWVAACRQYEFVGEFALEVVRERFLLVRPTLTAIDVDDFIARKAVWHPELAQLKPTTLRKVPLELEEYEHDVLYPLAMQQIAIDLDDGGGQLPEVRRRVEEDPRLGGARMSASGGGLEGQSPPDVRGDRANGEILLYLADAGAHVQLEARGGIIWLTQAEMASLYGTSGQNVGQIIRRVLADGEADEATTNSEFVVRLEGSRSIRREVKVYNLDMVLAVGYRVTTPRAVRLRQWATSVLREYLVKGFAMDDAKLKAADGWDYFDEWRFAGTGHDVGGASYSRSEGGGS